METSLHRQLKQRYAVKPSHTEVTVGDYRIDAVRGDELIEIQQASLGAIGPKITRLLAAGHRVRVVKPIAATTRIRRAGSPEGHTGRRSPKRGRLVDLFDDLVHFLRVFPRPGLLLDVALCDVEELRGAAPIRTGRRTRDPIEDRRLLDVTAEHSVRTAADLLTLLPGDLPADGFTTADLAVALGVRPRLAQRIAYCCHTLGLWRRADRVRAGYRYERADLPAPAPAIVAA